MLWPVVSIASWCASRPRSAVCSPMKDEMPIARSSSLQIEHPPLRRGEGGGSGGALAAGVIAHVGAAVGQPQQVIEERELLLHQRTVDAVLALDLLAQAAQLRAELGGRGGELRIHQVLEEG